MLIDKVKLSTNSTQQASFSSSSNSSPACRGGPLMHRLDANNNQLNSSRQQWGDSEPNTIANPNPNANNQPSNKHPIANNPNHSPNNNNNNNNKITINNSSTYSNNNSKPQTQQQFKSTTLPVHRRSLPTSHNTSIVDSCKSLSQQPQPTGTKLCQHNTSSKSHTWTGNTAKQEMAIVKQQHQSPPAAPPQAPIQHHQQQQHQQQSELCRQTNNQIVCEQNSSEPCSVNATMTIRRILQLYELGEYREAAQVISRLPYGIFRAVVLDLPVDAFVEAMPVSLPILDSLYAKVFFAGRDLLAFGFKFLHPENVVSHMIRMFAMGSLFATAENEEAISICKKLLKVILITDSSLRKQLLIKKALLDRAVEGMGHHGLVGTSNDALMNLHEALKLEFERVIQQYKGAIAKIDELSLTRNIKDGGPITRSLSQGPAPTFSSHQRLLSLKQEEIQDRLNKNRSLLCALEPCFRTNHSLQILLAILQKRIDYDKETLFQFGQLRKEYVAISSAVAENVNGPYPSNGSSGRHNSTTTNSSSSGVNNKSSSQLCTPFERDAVVAPVLMRFSHGCAQVLNLLKEIQQETGTEDDDEVVLTAHCIAPGPTSSMTNSAPVSDDPTSSTSDTQPQSNSELLPLEPNSVDNSVCNGHSNCNGSRKSSNRTPPVVNGGTTTDDSSDISGYHSDSDGSPIITQSPLATNNHHNHHSHNPHNHHNHHHHSHHNTHDPHSQPSSLSSSYTNGPPPSTIHNNNHSDKLVDRVAILTGRPNGTTLLDGEVSVNCGTRLSLCESAAVVFGGSPHHLSHHSNQSKQSSHHSDSICRIQVNDKPSHLTNTGDNRDNVSTDNNDNNNHDNNAEVCLLRCELAQAQARIVQLEASQSALQQKLTTQSKRLVSLGIGSKFDSLNLDESLLVSGLIRCYEQLYSQVRLDTLDALDQFEELNGLSELKTKLLFSIIVLSYRSTEQTLRDISSSVQSLLRIDNQLERLKEDSELQKQNDNHHEDLVTAKHEMENAIGHYLRLTSAYFDTQKNVKEVCTQIWNTLFDYPCLQKCPELVDFVQQCVQLSWSLHVQQSRFSLGIETKMFRDEWHSRAYQSDPFATAIKCYVWPTLFQEGICVYKGIVLT